MTLFRSRRALVERLEASDWKNDQQRDLLIEAAQKLNLGAAEAIPLLMHAEPRIRQLGVDQFLAGADLAACRRLLEEGNSQPGHVRAFVGRTVARVKEDVLAAVLEELVAHADPRRQRQGWEIALGLKGSGRQAWLQRAAREAPDSLRLQALKLLIDQGQLTDLSPLIQAARSEDKSIAELAMSCLENQQGPQIQALMLDRFAQGQGTVRERAATWLRKAAQTQPQLVRPQLMSLLGEGEDSTRRICIEILLETGDPAQVLLEVLAYAKNLVGWLRARILDTLQTFGDEVLRPAVQLLNHEDEAIRTNALVLAERFDDKRLVGPVCRLLQDPDWWLRITACDTLGRLGDERALPYLVKALEDEDTRWAAIDAMGRIGSTKALGPLTQLLREPREEVRLEVISALERFDEARLLPLLRQVMDRDPDGSVRARAEEAMRAISVRLKQEAPGTEAGIVGQPDRKPERMLDRLLAQARKDGASDIHLTVGEPPLIRHHGVLTRMEAWPVQTAAQTEAALFEILSERQAELARQAGEIDFCHAIPEVGRYRANLYHQRKGWAAAFRVIPTIPPSFVDLHLPARLTELADYHQGIIVVSGPAGSGKSTTLAALVNLINQSRPLHIITLEDPIEFVHPVKVALVNQREVGRHTESFSRALRGALREDPDVVMVGEMRDLETIRMALEAAETGHLVIATMHTTSAIQTVERLVKAFPPDEQPQVRMSLSESLKYVVSQSLIPRKDGHGRVAVYEVLKGTLSVGNLIRDNKSYQIPSLMQIGRSVGMQTRDMALMDLVEHDMISAEEAWLRAEQPAAFESRCSARFIARMQQDLHEDLDLHKQHGPEEEA